MKKTMCFFLFILGGISYAQVENIPLVTVTGESTVKVKPDYVVLGVEVKKDFKPGGFEIFKSEDTKIRLFELSDTAISESLIQIDSFKSDTSCYIKEVFISINDVKKLDRFLYELHKAGFRNYVFIDYRVRNFEAYKNRARKKAIHAAKKEAGLLASEMGQSIGKAHIIKEMETEIYNWYDMDDKEKIKNATSIGTDFYLSAPGYIVITSKIRVSFDLQK